MGGLFSKFDPAVVDGRGTRATPSTPLYTSIILKTPESKEKLRQLLRALVNYEPSNVGTILVSLWFLGADKHRLSSTFDSLSISLRQWPEENPIADSLGDPTLRDFFGKPQYLQRYFEFFRDQLTEFTQWHEILGEYLPMFGERLLLQQHAPLHLLAAAVEIDDPVLAMHALAWACASPEEGDQAENGSEQAPEGPEPAPSSTPCTTTMAIAQLKQVVPLSLTVAASAPQLPFEVTNPVHAPQVRAQVLAEI